MTEEFGIEPLSPSAAENDGVISALTDLVNKVYATAEAGLWVDGAKRTSAGEMAEFAKSGELAVAIQGERLVGCVRIQQLDDDISEFGMLAADPACRGIGIGRELVRFSERQARDRGCGTMQLELLVPREWKHPSKEFLSEWYGRIGYAVTRTGDIAEYYPELSPLLATPCEFRIYHKNIGVMP